MAAIDKIYIDSWEKYCEIREYFMSCGEITDDFNNKFKPIDFLWYIEEKDFKERLEKYKSISIMNTPIYFDIWMIRKCQHIQWLQDDLKSKYSGGYSKTIFTNHNEDDLYYQILNHTSIYDKYKRNGLGKNVKINKKSFPIIPVYGINKINVDICLQDENNSWWYSEDDDYWYPHTEMFASKSWTSSHAHLTCKTYSPKSIFRKIQKWNLPKNIILNVNVWLYTSKRERYLYDFKIKTK